MHTELFKFILIHFSNFNQMRKNLIIKILKDAIFVPKKFFKYIVSGHWPVAKNLNLD